MKRRGEIMSSPIIIRCICGKLFMFIRDAITTCPYCGKKYKSHRTKALENKGE